MQFFLRRQRVFIFVVMLALLASVGAAADAPKNIILLIGDGMGIGQVSAGRCAGPGCTGRLAIDSMPITGFSINHPARPTATDPIVTDSAAAGTALATGVKTTNGTIGLDATGKRVASITEIAKMIGKSTGIISTKSIVDATPATFSAHVANRSMTPDIAGQQVVSRIDLFLGGGKAYFLPKAQGGMREDGRNLIEEAQKRGYDVVYSPQAMTSSKSCKIMGLFRDYDLLSEGAEEPTIAQMTTKAADTLSKNKRGFFLMSEGAKIDSKCHANDYNGLIKEILMFDDAVRAALEFAAKDGNTLVIVTADHETGGVAVEEPSAEFPKFRIGWISQGHTANMIGIYAYGPGAEKFSGTHENTDIPRICASLWGQKLN